MKPTLVVLILGTLARAQITFNVPTPATPTIQSAIAAAANGDMVVVAPGVYAENVSFAGKAITVRSAAGSAQTTIDAGGSGTVVSFRMGEGPAAVLDGFTITNGDGSGVPAPKGGGIVIVSASPTLRNCIVMTNVGRSGAAGGIHIQNGTPTIVDCVVENNAGGDIPLGKNQGRGGAGGIGIENFSVVPGPTIRRCVIRGNQGGNGGGFFLLPSLGGAGGISGSDNSLSGPFLLLENTVITQNTGGSAVPNGGGTPRGGAGGVQLVGIRLFAVHCSIADNAGGNAVTPGAGGLLLGGVAPGPSLLANSILWDDENGAGSPDEISDLVGNLIVYRCDVEGGFATGIGVLDSDPMFTNAASGDYTVVAGSPAIDAGACGSLPVPPTDLIGQPRVRGLSPDLGAHEAAGTLVNVTLIGTCEDLVVETLVGGNGDPVVQSKTASSGDSLSLAYVSPAGVFVGAFVASLIEAHTPPFPPDGVPGFPELDLGQNVILLETFTLPVAGSLAMGVVPPGLAGLTLRFQGLAISATAENGLYAATHAHDVAIL